MHYKKMFLGYGIFLLAMGLIGFLITHAKSALISGSASGIIMAGLSFLVDENKIADGAAKLLALVFSGVFGWRFYIALQALIAGNAEKLIPAILLGLMGIASIVIAIVAFTNGKKD